ncbi:MAG: HlyD family efflux transporter periplasmic adaptor subunit [Clostridia bacterium]|nr:HlyD family efflux transporter periplasmic adaptor subunit [Clostridia bacterium]
MNKKLLKKLGIIIFIALLIIGAFLIGRKSGLMTDTSTTTTTITEETVTKRTIQNVLSASGEISSNSTEKITLDTTKYFKAMCVEEDDIVSIGDNILEYTDGTYLTATYNLVISSYSVPETGSKCTSSNYIEVQTTDDLIMTISVNENQINGLSNGQEVTITPTTNETLSYKGTVTKIDSIGTYASSGTTFNVSISFKNDGNLKLGMSASCEVVLEEVADVLTVPIAAVQTEDDKKYVVIVNDDGDTENVEITTGLSDDDYVEIKTGLEEGQIVQVATTTTKSTTRSKNSNGGRQNGERESSNLGDFPGGSGNMPSEMGEPPSENSRSSSGESKD